MSDLIETLGLSQEELQEMAVERIARDFLSHDGGELQSRLENRIYEHADAAVARLADDHVLPKVGEFIENLVLQKTNDWGEKKGEALTFVEYLIRRADSYMGERVNSKGKTKEEDSYSWRGTQTRLSAMIDGHLHHEIDTAMKEALTIATKSLGRDLAETAKIKLAEISAKLKVEVATK